MNPFIVNDCMNHSKDDVRLKLHNTLPHSFKGHHDFTDFLWSIDEGGFMYTKELKDNPKLWDYLLIWTISINFDLVELMIAMGAKNFGDALLEATRLKKIDIMRMIIGAVCFKVNQKRIKN
jgi:hypothetical protein